MGWSALGVVLFVAQACGDPTNPTTAVRGAFDVQLFYGQSLPVVTRWDGGSTSLIAERIGFDGYSHGWDTAFFRTINSRSPAPGSPFTIDRPFTYVHTGSRIAITFTCEPTVVCPPGPHLARWRATY
jgi:hypothetical protein